MQEQMQRPEVQEQMKEAQALMQDKGFAEKVEKLKVSWLAADTGLAVSMLRAHCVCYINVLTSTYPVCIGALQISGQIVSLRIPGLTYLSRVYINALLTNLCYRKTLS